MKSLWFNFALVGILAASLPVWAQDRHDSARPRSSQQNQDQPQRIPPPNASRNQNQGADRSVKQNIDKQSPPPQQEAPQPNDQQQQAPERSQRSGPSIRFHGAGPHMGDWLRRFGNAPRQEQKKQLENDPSFQQLPPERQEKLRERLDKFNNLPEDRRNRILKRMEVFEHMTPEQQREAQDMFGRLRSLPDDRRSAVRRAARALRGMPPEARERSLNSDNVRNNFNDQEREILRGLSNLEAPEADPKDDQ